MRETVAAQRERVLFMRAIGRMHRQDGTKVINSRARPQAESNNRLTRYHRFVFYLDSVIEVAEDEGRFPRYFTYPRHIVVDVMGVPKLDDGCPIF